MIDLLSVLLITPLVFTQIELKKLIIVNYTERSLNAELLLLYSVSKSKSKTILLDIKASKVRANGKMVSENFIIKKSDYFKIFITNQKSIFLEKY